MAKSTKARKKLMCRRCKLPFVPTRKWQRFCSANCRKSYNKYGNLPFDRLLDRAAREARAAVAGEIERLEERIQALEARLPEVKPEPGTEQAA